MKRTRRRFGWVASFVLVVLPAALAHAEPADAPGWEFSVTPYVWLFNLTGDVGAAGRESSVDTSLIDLFQNNDSVIGLQANFQARNGPWTLLLDPTWLRIEDDFHVGHDIAGVDADLTASVTLIDVMAMREAWRMPLGERIVEKGMRQPALALDLLAGMRIQILRTELDLDVSSPVPQLDGLRRSFDKTQSWADPVIGARATLDLSNHLHLIGRGDIGGFHVGSDFTSELWASLVLDFSVLDLDTFGALGYRALYTDYDGDNGFTMHTWIHGPTLGVGVRF